MNFRSGKNDFPARWQQRVTGAELMASSPGCHEFYLCYGSELQPTGTVVGIDVRKGPNWPKTKKFLAKFLACRDSSRDQSAGPVTPPRASSASLSTTLCIGTPAASRGRCSGRPSGPSG